MMSTLLETNGRSVSLAYGRISVEHMPFATSASWERMHSSDYLEDQTRNHRIWTVEVNVTILLPEKSNRHRNSTVGRSGRTVERGWPSQYSNGPDAL